MDKINLFNEISNHLMNDDKPSKYLNELMQENKIKTNKIKSIFKLKQIEQNPKYHPEGDVWQHTMMVIDEASKIKHKSKDSKVLMWAALLHDIGKITTTRIRKGRITSYEHDFVGAKLTKDILSDLTENQDFIEKVSILVKYHMHTFYINKNLPFGDLRGLKRDVDLEELALLSLSDRLGRAELNEEGKKEIFKFIEDFKKKMHNI